MRTPLRTAPWSLSDIRAAFFTTAAGSSALVAAWWGASGTARQDDHVTWTVVAIAGIILIGIGSFFWLLAGKWAVAVRRDTLMERVTRVEGELAAARLATAAPGGDADWLTVPGTTRYHRPGCLLVRGHDARRVGVSARSRLRACEMCRP